jgi:uncharacterized protein YqgC (DUF456 family)
MPPSGAIAVLIAVLLLAALAWAWVSTLFGLPGNWLILALTALYVWLVPHQWPATISWVVVFVLAGLAVLGELLELMAAALGTTKAGGSRRGAALALVGSMVGGILGMFVGLPVPIVGSLLAALLFAALGALGGAMLGERWKGRRLHESWQTGKAAFWGRLLGTAAKAMVGSVMIAVVAVARAVDGW